MKDIDLVIPTGQISFIVGNHHVSDSDSEIEADIRKRLEGAPGVWTPELVEAAVSYALREHHENQQTYREVQAGDFS